jgi:flavin reductase (DIM6/NTAB) family NADH-FMN oxidoreductase RutF
MKRAINPKMLYFGTPVVLLSSENPDGTTNLAPISSAWWLGRSALLGMSVHSQTVRNLLERPRVVLNLVDAGMVDAVDRLALLTGRSDVPAYKAARGYTYAADKFAAAGLTPTDMSGGGPDGVAECLLQLTGDVVGVHEVGGPDDGLRALEVAVTGVFADEHVLLPDHENHLDPLAWDPMIMKFTEYFGQGSLLRPSSLAAGWQMPPLWQDASVELAATGA